MRTKSTTAQQAKTSPPRASATSICPCTAPSPSLPSGRGCPRRMRIRLRRARILPARGRTGTRIWDSVGGIRRWGVLDRDKDRDNKGGTARMRTARRRVCLWGLRPLRRLVGPLPSHITNPHPLTHSYTGYDLTHATPRLKFSHAKAGGRTKKQALSCYFCRERKIACGRPEGEVPGQEGGACK
jgi:hypothetical protein